MLQLNDPAILAFYQWWFSWHNDASNDAQQKKIWAQRYHLCFSLYASMIFGGKWQTAFEWFINTDNASRPADIILPQC